MLAEENKATIRRYHDQFWNKGKVEAFEEFVAQDVVPHSAPGVTDAEGMKRGAAMIRNAFPDIQIALDDEIAAGDKVVARWTIRATHQGEIFGVPATGKKAVWSGITIFRLAGGKIAEYWLQGDNMSLMQQLGAIPTPGQG